MSDATHGSSGIMQQAARVEQDALDAARSGATVNGGIPIPGGRVVPVSAFHGIESLPTRDHTRYLSEPEKYIVKDPKPGWRYVWASADEKYNGNVTSGMIRSRRYQPVKESEIKDRVDFDVHFKTHKGIGDVIYWRDLMLCAVPPEYAAEQYDGPVGDYLRKLGALQDGFMDQVESTSGGLAVGHATQNLNPG